MLSTHLATPYGVAPKVLVQAVKRNARRFPPDFMFQLSPDEFANLKSQFVISSWGGLRSHPYAFTQEGVAMLSGVLNSPRAIRVNVSIMRTFVRLRQEISAHKDLTVKLTELERHLVNHDEKICSLFDAINHLMITESEDRKEIGFRPPEEE